MSKRYRLTDDEIAEALNELPGWEIKSGKLHKVFIFKSFSHAIGWLVTVATHVEKMDHHPEWSNVYNKVTVDLVTHHLGNAISNWDVELARKMESLLTN